MNAPSRVASGDDLLAIYDDALADVYDYLHRRCRHRATAEDLTTEVFMAAVDSIRRGVVETVTIAWLMGIARHKLVDHWRRTEREERRVEALTDAAGDAHVDDWNVHLDALVAHDVLHDLAEQHRSALVLRYVDDLPVADVAETLGRTLQATEALLVRAKRAFRTRYEEVAQ